MTPVLLLLLTISITSAQILMKVAANASNNASPFSTPVIILVGLSFAISCVGQLLWFYILRSAPLSTSYIFLSLVFILVPLAGWWLFDETLQPLHFLSIGLIFTGISLLGLVGNNG